ncbi:hypothetical protein BS50DRAFT_622750 [Corynespora cassiicola Philippines]|uniref:Zn(2)-C6 fungal-type domain-containing protein n=1 Tax=Corynespora cassiicola Philippines TaxID=1448308 RepID=A0A2T2NJH3_CORCC|nr:hypothetical protein BS50DRAFT_622750 [Corynespora cassiicola Philippines]
MSGVAPSPMESMELAHATSARGQVCDRCRLKKIKCNASSPCDKCSAAGTPCTVSATLRRKTTARGFATSEADTIKRLESENASLSQQLETERRANAQLREELKRKTQVTQGRKRKLPDTGTDQSPLSISADSTTTRLDRGAYVIKHMGRLVRDQSGIGRFAGSTTGVHFVLSVQDACRSIASQLDPFPEPCYCSHLIQPLGSSQGAYESNDGTEHADQHLPLTIEEALKSLQMTLEDISRHLHLFDTQWSSFCPIIIREEIIRKIGCFFLDSNHTRRLSGIDYAVLQIIFLVTKINQPSEALSETTDTSAYHIPDSLVHRIHLTLLTQADLWTLQALIVYSLFIQKRGERLAMIPLNGAMVQIAQSLGLHRHARRFKFEAGEVELRKRIWWSVYIFDKLTAITHGLPQLISNADVDNDLPIDCILQDMASPQLLHPLPGESTSVSVFCHYVSLMRISSKMLGQLYTTTDRRGGAEKIKQLDLDLRMWASNFNNHPHVEPIELGIMGRKRAKSRDMDDDALMGQWLELLANTCRILIHRPGLTFDRATPQFRESLIACTSSASAIVDLLDEDAIDHRLQIFVPSGPSLIFQSALMLAHYHCCIYSEDQLPIVSYARSLDLIDQSIRTLDSMSEAFTTYHSDGINPIARISPLADLIKTLQKLQCFLTVMEKQENTELPASQHINLSATLSSPTDDLGLGSLQQSQHLSADMELWSIGGLESLNQIGDIDGIFDFEPMFNQIL